MTGAPGSDPGGRDLPAAAGVERRDLLGLLTLAGLGAGVVGTASTAKPAQDIPARPTTHAVELFARLVGDLSGKVGLIYSAGAVWGFLPQADGLALSDFARRLYGYRSLVARKVRRLPNGDITIKQQGWTFYADPVTDLITDTLRNPYTGVDVKPYSPPSAASEIAYRPDGSAYVPGKEDANPVGGGSTTAPDNPFDMRVKVIGAHAFVSTSQFIRFRPADIDWWKLEATLITYNCRAADVLNPRLSHIPSTWTMNLVAEWQTWMNMHGSPGHILFKGEGAAIADIRDAPSDYQAALASKFPGQLEKALAW